MLDQLQQIRLLLPDRNILSRYASWSIVDNYDTRLTYDMLITFIVGAYHSNTPLNTIDDFVKRKYEAAKLANFPLDEDGIHIHTKVILNQDVFVNQLILDYLNLFKSPIFKQSVIYKDELEKELLSLNTLEEENPKVKADARKIMLQNIKEITSRLEEAALHFLQGDNSRELLMTFYENIEINTIGLVIEEVAQNLKEGRRPLGNVTNPYERN